MLASDASFSSIPYLASQTVRSFWMSALIAGRRRRISAALCVAVLALRTSWAAGSMMTEEYSRPIALVDLRGAVRMQAVVQDHLDVDGLEVLRGRVVLRHVLPHPPVHDHDVVERVQDHVETLAEGRRVDLPEEHLHADVAGRDDAEDREEEDEGRHADGEAEDDAGDEAANPGRQALGPPAQRPVEGEPDQQDHRGEDQLAHRASPSRRVRAVTPTRWCSAAWRRCRRRRGSRP